MKPIGYFTFSGRFADFYLSYNKFSRCRVYLIKNNIHLIESFRKISDKVDDLYIDEYHDRSDTTLRNCCLEFMPQNFQQGIPNGCNLSLIEFSLEYYEIGFQVNIPIDIVREMRLKLLLK
jgi:hypothetical protein